MYSISFVELFVVGVNEAASVVPAEGIEDMVVGSGVVSISINVDNRDTVIFCNNKME